MRDTRHDTTTYCFGDWTFDYSQNALIQNNTDTSARLEPKVSELLRLLLNSNGEVVSRDRLIEALWPGVVVGEDTLARTVSRLRSVLSDSAKAPTYIETIPKKGYRFLLPLVEAPAAPTGSKKTIYLSVGVVLALLSAVALYLFSSTPSTLVNERLARADRLYMHFDEQDNEAAIALYEQVLETEPKNARARAGIANALIQRLIRWPAQKYRDKMSRVSLTAALASGQLKTPEAKLMLERVRLLAEKAVRQSPSDVLALKSLGFAYSAEGNLVRAIEVYQQAIELDQNAWRSLINLGELYMLNDQQEKALQTLVQAFNAMQARFKDEPALIGPWQPELGNMIAQWYATAGDAKNTQIWAEKVLALEPFERKASALLVEALRTSDNLDQAKKVCDAYAKKLPPLKICTD